MIFRLPRFVTGKPVCIPARTLPPIAHRINKRTRAATAVVEGADSFLRVFAMSRLIPPFLVPGVWAAAALLLAGIWAGTRLDGATETGPTPGESYPGVFGPDAKQGYVLRQESWNGALSVGENIPIRQQLFKNNDYRFYAWTDVKGAKVSVHVYDQDGNLIDGHTGEKSHGDSHFAEVDVKPESTGSYYLIVKVEQSSAKSTAWQMAYAYK